MFSIIINAITMSNKPEIANGYVTIKGNKIIYGTIEHIDMIDTIIEHNDGTIELRRKFDNNYIHVYSFENEYDAAAWLLGYDNFKDCAHMF